MIRPIDRCPLLALLGLGVVSMILGASQSSAGDTRDPARVEVVRNDDGWELLRDGTPFEIRGAGGSAPLEILRSIGGNAIRTWGAEDLRRVQPSGRTLLGEADEHGVAICAGFWMEHPRHGHDYDDPAFVEAQLDELRAFVREYRDEPSILIWGVGNEVELGADPRRILTEMNRAAREVKEIDPSRPTMVVIAEIGDDKVRLFDELCPDVDILGINSYAGMGSLPRRLREAGYDGPYIVTEYGTPGHWETGSTPWGAPFEPTSTQKARFLDEVYDKTIDGDPNCLGGFAFAWGWKQEVTDTWYGLFTPSGEMTQRIEVLREKWTGSPGNNLCPTIEPIRIPATDLNAVAPGRTITARVEARDPDDDELEYRWLVRAVPTTQTVGGDHQDVPPAIDVTIDEPSPGNAVVRVPATPGAYRLFVFVTDGKGHAATANVPFRVVDAG